MFNVVVDDDNDAVGNECLAAVVVVGGDVEKP